MIGINEGKRSRGLKDVRATVLELVVLMTKEGA